MSVENIEDMQQLDWDISSLATGVYFVKALDEEGTEYLTKVYLVGR